MEKIITFLLIAIFILLPSRTLAAIAYNSSSTFGNAATGATLTFAHTISGTDTVLFVSTYCGSHSVGLPTGVTYNGASMTLVTYDMGGELDIRNTMWVLKNPSAGTNNIVVSKDSTYIMGVVASSYTGVDQTNPVEAVASNTVTTLANSITTSVITLTDNAWLVSSASANGQSAATVAGTGLTKRAGCKVNNVSDYLAIGDSNGAKSPPGSYSGTWNFSITDRDAMIILSLKPSGSGSATQTYQPIINFE